MQLVDQIAQHIRFVDGGNKLDAYDLGDRIASYLYNDLELISTESQAIKIESFVARTNPDKTMGAGALAELIVAEFDLDEVDA